jgi:hypothetical protein
MNASAELPFSDLLTRAGAVIRSRTRADCPRCKRQRAINFDESKGVYHCHGAGCDFSGGSAKLARDLGLARTLSRQERGQLHQQYESADRAARVLYARVKARRFELLQELRWLGRIEWQADQAGMDHHGTWDALALVYRQRPGLLAELAILENWGAADLVQFFRADAEIRQRAIARVIAGGGLWEKRRMACWHCDTSVVAKDRKPGRCIQCAWPGGCWRGCRGACLACEGAGPVLCDVLIEMAA